MARRDRPVFGQLDRLSAYDEWRDSKRRGFKGTPRQKYNRTPADTSRLDEIYPGEPTPVEDDS